MILAVTIFAAIITCTDFRIFTKIFKTLFEFSTTKLLDRDVGYIRQDIAELTESKTKIEEFRKRAKEIADLAEKLQKDCPKIIGDIFDIKRYWAGK